MKTAPGNIPHRLAARWQWMVVGLVCFICAAAPEAADRSNQLLIDSLRGGGFNIYFRHAATDWSQQDNVAKPADWRSCDPTKARQLSDRGRETARSIGQAMRRLDIPVSEVLASPYCRTMETARLMQVGDVAASDAVINMRVASHFGGRNAVIESARLLLGSSPPGGGNRVIVAHGNVARDATPVYPSEAEAVVFRPDGHGQFEAVGRLTPAQLAALAARGGPTVISAP